jgi:hypothetical protein
MMLVKSEWGFTDATGETMAKYGVHATPRTNKQRRTKETGEN